VSRRYESDEARNRCGVESGERQHRALVVSPQPAVAKRSMEINALSGSNERFQMLQEAPLRLVPSHITSHVHRRAADHGSPRQGR
jgi:hypothetical protein